MPYVKTEWVDNLEPALNAENLNKIEQGIYDAHQIVPQSDFTPDQIDAIQGANSPSALNPFITFNDASSVLGDTISSKTPNSNLTLLGDGTGHVVIDDDLEILGDVVSLKAGVPTFESTSNINLTAANAVIITSSPFRVASFTTAERDLLTPLNGDIIYNTTLGRIQGFENNAWVNLGGV